MQLDKLKYLAGEYNFNLIYLEKDYALTLLLSYIKDVEKIYSYWDKDLLPLVNKQVDYLTVIRAIKKYFDAKK